MLTKKTQLRKGAVTGLVAVTAWTIIWFFLLDTDFRTYLYKFEDYGFGVNGYLAGIIPFSFLSIFMSMRKGVQWGIGMFLAALALLFICLFIFILIVGAGLPNFRY